MDKIISLRITYFVYSFICVLFLLLFIWLICWRNTFFSKNIMFTTPRLQFVASLERTYSAIVG